MCSNGEITDEPFVIMKTSNFSIVVLLAFGFVACAAVCPSFAADTNSAATPAPSQPAVAADAQADSASTSVKLPYGVDDVLKLSRAQISEDIILNYVQNSGTAYNLAPQDIVYLHNQGVSDRVVNAMLDQRKRVTEAAAAAIAAQPAPSAAPVEVPAPAPTYTDAANGYTEPAPDYSQSAPAGSSVYVIPYPAASTAYYGYYAGPYYGGYYGPVVSFGYRYGGCWGRYGGRVYYGGRHYGHHH